MKKIALVIITITVLLIGFSNVTFAAEIREITQVAQVEEKNLTNILAGADDFITKGEANQENTIKKEELEAGINLLYTMTMAIGTFIAIVVGVIVGIKLMMASSAEEKAQYKKTLVVYVAGCVVIFGAIGIWTIVVNTIGGAT